MREDRFLWLRRLRWRLRGASQGPAFAVFTVAEAVLLQALPVSGDHGPGIVGALLIAGFLNLLAIAVVGPLGGLWMRRRDPTRPAFAARDRAAVLALAATCALVLLAGLLHAPAARRERHELQVQAIAARRWFRAHAPPAYRANLDRMSTRMPGTDVYRTCLPGPDPDRELCVYVLTDHGVQVRPDRSQVPNALLDPGDPGYIVR